MDAAAELAKWVPQGVLALGAVMLARHYAERFLARIDGLELKVDRSLAELTTRVTVADHRESMREVHNKLNAVSERATRLEERLPERRRR